MQSSALCLWEEELDLRIVNIRGTGPHFADLASRIDRHSQYPDVIEGG